MPNGMLLLHGISGTGKSTLVQLLAHEKATVVYDCFAGGEGLHAGGERFPYTKCFVQIIGVHGLDITLKGEFKRFRSGG